MKDLDDLKQLFKMQQGALYSNLLLQGIKLGVFDCLKKGLTSDELAEQIETHPLSTLYFLRGLTATGLLNVEKDLFCNSYLSNKYLVKDSENYLGDYFESFEKWYSPIKNSLYGILKSGPVIPEIPADSEEVWAKSAAHMINYQKTCTGPVFARTIKENLGINLKGKMLDLGGGPGLNAMAVLKENPLMTGSLFDRPGVIKIAEAEIEKNGMKNRLLTIPGDFESDDFGKDWNLITATCCLNFQKDKIQGLIKKIFDSLAPKGIFISIHDALTENKTKPRDVSLSWLPSSFMSQDLGMEMGVISDAMEKAGFKTIKSSPIDFGFGIMELDIAKKD